MPMTYQQVSLLLSKVQAYDNRDIGEAVIRAWHESLGDLELGDCLAAVTHHFAESQAWLMPAHIRELVRPMVERLPSWRPLADHFVDLPETNRAGPGYAAYRFAKSQLDRRGPGDVRPETDPVRARALDRARRERPVSEWAAHRGISRSDGPTDGSESSDPGADTDGR